MIKKISVLIVMVILISCTQTSTTEQTSYLIQPQKFKEMMSEEKEVVVLDVRTPEEVAAGVIGNPTVINFRDEDFKEQILALDKSKTYLVYCKSGGRSGQTKALMDENGFKAVYDLKGGITAWKDTGLLTE